MYKVTNISNNRAKNGACFRPEVRFGPTSTFYDLRMEPWVAGKLVKLGASIRITKEEHDMNNTQILLNRHVASGVLEVVKLTDSVVKEDKPEELSQVELALKSMDENQQTLSDIIPQLGDDEEDKRVKKHKKGHH